MANGRPASTAFRGGKYVLKGYQADIDGKSNFTGMLYEERGRGFVAPRGQFVRMSETGATKPRLRPWRRRWERTPGR